MALNYWIKANEHTYTIDPGEDSSEPYSYRGSSGLDLSIDHIYNHEQKGPDITWFPNDSYYAIYGYDEIELGAACFIVVVKYQTGDTFGSHETWTVPAIKADINDAYEALRKCNGPGPNDYSRAWDGYFEHLLSVEVVDKVML